MRQKEQLEQAFERLDTALCGTLVKWAIAAEVYGSGVGLPSVRGSAYGLAEQALRREWPEVPTKELSAWSAALGGVGRGKRLGGTEEDHRRERQREWAFRRQFMLAQATRMRLDKLGVSLPAQPPKDLDF